MNAPLPEVPPPNSRRESRLMPPGLQWIVALQITTFLVSMIVVMVDVFSDWDLEDYEPLQSVIEVSLMLTFMAVIVALYALLFFFLGRGSRVARFLFISCYAILVIGSWIWPDFFASDEPTTLLEDVLGSVLDALWFWTLIYLFLPKVRAYFRAK